MEPGTKPATRPDRRVRDSHPQSAEYLERSTHHVLDRDLDSAGAEKYPVGQRDAFPTVQARCGERLRCARDSQVR
jgi:hypothetical protein